MHARLFRIIRVSTVNMPFGALFFLVGSGIAISGCLASPREEEASKICVRRLNLNEEEAGLIMFVTVGADDYEVVSDENGRCLVDCIAHEAGFLDVNDKFTVSEFIDNELKDPSMDENEQKDRQDNYKMMTECEETVENWDGWNRTAKCQKGYLFFKCKSYGPDGFKLYMDLHRKLASGELMPREYESSSSPDVSDSATEDSDSEVTVRSTKENNSTERNSSQEPSVSTEGLSERVSGISLNEEILPSIQLNTPNKM